MMGDEELKKEILDCLPIEGPDPENYYIDCYHEDITTAVQNLLHLLRKVERTAYERGKRGEPL